ncbi:MAG: hypothetical protein KatS3mg060_0989 [Dehalococcoidia bacterium]|nr:MAG: hypothetical protein KatS3mg060_0989 [Dehalococcoidia bacterium]
MQVTDCLTGLERVTISAARFYPVESSSVAVPSPADGRLANPKAIPASDVNSRLGLHDGQTVFVRGRGDAQIIDGLYRACGTPLVKSPDRADVVLYWPAGAEALRRELPELVEQLQPRSLLWIVASRPGLLGCNGPAIPQGDLIAIARDAGLVDNRVAFLSDCEYGYRFARAD